MFIFSYEQYNRHSVLIMDLDRFSCLHTHTHHIARKCHALWQLEQSHRLAHSLSLRVCVRVPVYVCASALLLYFTFHNVNETVERITSQMKNTNTDSHAQTHTVCLCVYASGTKNLLWYARKLTKLMISLYTANGSIIQNSRRIYRHPRAVQLKSSFYDIAWFPLCIHFWKYPSFDSCHVAA